VHRKNEVHAASTLPSTFKSLPRSGSVAGGTTGPHTVRRPRPRRRVSFGRRHLLWPGNGMPGSRLPSACSFSSPTSGC
jgi:hypothetical protein